MADLHQQLETILGDGFRVERELGGGGMSRVFLVHDDALDRDTVVKVLPPDLSAGLSAERFKREIQVAARLQHPHIVPLLNAGAREGLLYYVMPYIGGESLRSRLARGHELPIGEVTRILRDVVDGLSYAHAHGVIHRDIKPDNVLMTGHHALVTDFGVARALSSAGDANITSVGIALGTPAYMSPEQAAADPSMDHRADLYSVGALGYELLAGRPPFTGMTPQQVLAAHLSVQPDHVTRHRATVPPALADLIMRCLEKRAADRWQSADELLAHLESMATPSGGLQPSSVALVRARWPIDRRVVGSVLAIAAIAVAAAWWVLRPPPTHTVGSTTQITNTPGLELDAAISPDGRLLAYTAGSLRQTRVFVRQVSGGTARALTDAGPGAQRTPRWTADGQSITFLVGQSLYRAPALGGTPELLIDASGYEFASPALSPDGRSVAYADQNALYVRPLTGAGGPDRKVAAVPYPNYITWSPDGRRLAFVSDNGWFIYGLGNFGNLAPSSVWVADTESETPVRITTASHLSTSPVWTPDGRSILYVSSLGGGRDIYQQALSRRGRPRGQATRITTGLGAHTISLSADGKRLAYSVLTTTSNLWSAPISASGVTPFSAATPVTNENQTVEGMGLSPDGKWLVYDSNRGGAQQIFRIPVAGGEPIQLTRDSADKFLPSWSPDGRQVAYHSWQAGNRDVYVIDADGREPRAVTTYPSHEMYPMWSPSGRQLLFISDRDARWELYTISRTNDDSWSEPRQITTDFGYNGRWSPDGRYVAYVSLADSTIRVADAGGTGSRLLFDGRTLGLTTPQVAFGRRPDVLYFQAIERDSRRAFYEIPLRGGAPRLVFRFSDPTRQPRRSEFDTDGRRLFFTVATDESDVWVMELARK